MRNARLANLLLVPVLLLGAAQLSEASKREVNVNSDVKSDSAAFGQIPTSVDRVMVLVEDAKVHITRTGSGTISVSSPCPRNWNVNGALVRQAGFAKPRQGVAMMADALGSRAIVNGKIYPLPQGGMKGLSMNKDGVTIGGQKVDPIQGTDAPGTCDGADSITVKAPDSFTGGLLMGASGATEAQIDSWKGGTFECTLMSNSSLKTGSIGPVDKAVIDLRGTGKVEIDNIAARVLVVNVGGPGTVTIKGGSADITNLTVSGKGAITAKGKFKGLQKAVEGGAGTITVTD
jgi:hypothetical protein